MEISNTKKYFKGILPPTVMQYGSGDFVVVVVDDDDMIKTLDWVLNLRKATNNRSLFAIRIAKPC